MFTVVCIKTDSASFFLRDSNLVDSFTYQIPEKYLSPSPSVVWTFMNCTCFNTTSKLINILNALAVFLKCSDCLLKLVIPYFMRYWPFLNLRFIWPTRKAPGALDIAVFPHPLRMQNTLWSLKIRAQWCTFLELVIYRTFDVFAANPPPPPLDLLCTLLLVIT